MNCCEFFCKCTGMGCNSPCPCLDKQCEEPHPGAAIAKIFGGEDKVSLHDHITQFARELGVEPCTLKVEEKQIYSDSATSSENKFSGPLSQQGNKILHDLFSTFSSYYVERHEGCNGNEVEREFLHEINYRSTLALALGSADLYAKYLEEIKKIH